MILSLNAMKCVNEPALPTQILLALMHQIPMYEDQRPRFDLS